MVLVGVEDELSQAVAKVLVEQAGFDVKLTDFIVERGAGNLRKHLPRYLAAGVRRTTLVLTDLDDVECAPTLVRQWLSGRAATENFMIRVAVREIEAWLLADRTAIHRFFGIPLRRVSGEPDKSEDPKRELLTLAKGASADIRKGLVRTEDGKVFRGLFYNKKLGEFASRNWSSHRAAVNSASLRKAMNALNAARSDAAQATKH